MKKHDPILIKYRDEEKIITTINRPTENAAFKHMNYYSKFTEKDLLIYKQEIKFIQDGCDPELVVDRISNHLLMNPISVKKSLKRIERYLKYEEFCF